MAELFAKYKDKQSDGIGPEGTFAPSSWKTALSSNDFEGDVF